MSKHAAAALAQLHAPAAADAITALRAERDRLRAAIQTHRDTSWGTGRVGRVDDVVLYAALRCEAP